MALQRLILVPLWQVLFFTVCTKCKLSLHLCMGLIYSLLFDTLNRTLGLATPGLNVDRLQSVQRWTDFNSVSTFTSITTLQNIGDPQNSK